LLYGQSDMVLECRSMSKFALTTNDQSTANFARCPAKTGEVYISDQSSAKVNASDSIDVEEEDQAVFELIGKAEITEL